jgi:glutathione reductase (NADPH)
MAHTSFDSIVIGGGSAVLSFARNAARFGAHVDIVERDRLRGTCVNRECVPKKTLWTVARTLHYLLGLRGMGIAEGGAQVDLKAVSNNWDAKIDSIVESYGADLKDVGVTLFAGTARLDGDGGVIVGGRRLKAKHVVLATGGRSPRSDFLGTDMCVVSDAVFTWTAVPKRLVIIGVGHIGCEFAAIMLACGPYVTPVPYTEAVLTEFLKGWQKFAAGNFEAQGVALLLSAKPKEAVRSADGLSVGLDISETLTADHVLLAMGGDVNLVVLGDLADKMKLTDSGHIAIDDQFSMSLYSVYAIGNCADWLPMTLVAVDDGSVLAEQLFEEGADPIDLDHVATTAFMMPLAAQVGSLGSLDSGKTTAPNQNAVLDTGSDWLCCLTCGSPPPDANVRCSLLVHPTMTEGLLATP